MNSNEQLAQIDDLQTRYIAALNRRDMQAWLECFDEQSSYICIARENMEQGFELAFMMDDCYARLKDRKKFITEVWAGTFEDYTTRHFIQRLNCRRDSDASFHVESNFMVLYTSRRGFSEVLVGGSYDDRVALDGDNPRFLSKRAILDTTVAPRYLVYPV